MSPALSQQKNNPPELKPVVQEADNTLDNHSLGMLVMAQLLANQRSQTRSCSWIKRLGFVGFMFFFIKGLLWLSLPGILVFFGLGF